MVVRVVLKNYVKWCQQVKKPNPMIAFDGKCIKLVFSHSQPFQAKSPGNDCYIAVPQSIAFKPSDEDVDQYDLFMATLCREDSEAREIE